MPQSILRREAKLFKATSRGERQSHRRSFRTVKIMFANIKSEDRRTPAR